MSFGVVEPNTYVAIRQPSDTHAVLEVKPNTIINLGKYGQFPANEILGRPYYLTFEIIDPSERTTGSKHVLRIVPPSELHAADLEEAPSEPGEGDNEGSSKGKHGTLYDVVGEDGQVVMRTNQHIVDGAGSQILSMDEIEKLKASNEGSGKDLVKKILESHQTIDQKTAYALAKYTLRKTKKYVKRFTVLPLDVAFLAKWTLHEKQPSKILEMREETLSLIRSWSNVHFTPETEDATNEGGPAVGKGHWLVVDDTAGLLTASVAEQLGFLHYSKPEPLVPGQTNGEADEAEEQSSNIPDMEQEQEQATKDGPASLDGPIPPDAPASIEATSSADDRTTSAPPRAYTHRPPLSHSNTITVIHPLSQPNLSFLRYFSYDVFDPSPSHPLTSRLRTLSWLHLLDPQSTNLYQPPPDIPKSEIATWKPTKRSSHYRKLRRYLRNKEIIDSTRAGGFDGVIIASIMKPADMLHHLIPLLKGSAQVVVYSAHVEPLAELADYYSTARRTAFLNNPVDVPCEDFPVDPRLLLAPTIWSVRAKGWQVLPGRTHPLMTGKGGAEGFVFVGTRVLPTEGITARGNFAKRRKVGMVEEENKDQNVG